MIYRFSFLVVGCVYRIVHGFRPSTCIRPTITIFLCQQSFGEGRPLECNSAEWYFIIYNFFNDFIVKLDICSKKFIYYKTSQYGLSDLLSPEVRILIPVIIIAIPITTPMIHQKLNFSSHSGAPTVFFKTSITIKSPTRIIITAQNADAPRLPPAQCSSHWSSWCFSHCLPLPVKEVPHLLQNRASSGLRLPHLVQYGIISPLNE